MNTIFQEPFIDYDSVSMIVYALVQAYREKDRTAIEKAAQRAQLYVDAGGDFELKSDDSIEDYSGSEPEKLTEKYLMRLLHDRTMENDTDQEYIRTGWNKAILSQPVQLSLNF